MSFRATMLPLVLLIACAGPERGEPSPEEGITEDSGMATPGTSTPPETSAPPETSTTMDASVEIGAGDAGTSSGRRVLTTVFEQQVGISGDAVLKRVEVAPDGGLFATSSSAAWIIKLKENGSLDDQFGEELPNGTRKSGKLTVAASASWVAPDDTLLAPFATLDGLREIRAYSAVDGSQRFVSSLPYSERTGERAVAAAYDRRSNSVSVLQVRVWQMTSPFNGSLPQRVGPTELELLRVDAATGARTGRGVLGLPKWSGRTTPSGDQVGILGLFARPDGSHVFLVREIIDGRSAVRPNNIGQRLSVVRFSSSQPSGVFELAVSDLNARVESVMLSDGSLRIYLFGAVEGFSASPSDSKVVRLDVDATSLKVSPQLLGPGFDLRTGSSFCHAVAADETQVVYAEADDKSVPIRFTRYTLDGTVEHFSGDRPRRCVQSVTLHNSGALFVGSYDTSSPVWKVLISKLAP